MAQLWMLHKLTTAYAVSLAADPGGATWVLVLSRDGRDYVYTGTIDGVVLRAYNADLPDSERPTVN